MAAMPKCGCGPPSSKLPPPTPFTTLPPGWTLAQLTTLASRLVCGSTWSDNVSVAEGLTRGDREAAKWVAILSIASCIAGVTWTYNVNTGGVSFAFSGIGGIGQWNIFLFFFNAFSGFTGG